MVGAGIADSTLAYWLTRHGIETTVVERAEGQRSSGSPAADPRTALGRYEHTHRKRLLRPVLFSPAGRHDHIPPTRPRDPPRNHRLQHRIPSMADHRRSPQSQPPDDDTLNRPVRSGRAPGVLSFR